MLDFAEALERYTVIQLLAATPLMFMVWLIIREINGVVRGGHGKPANGQSNLVYAEAIGNMATSFTGFSDSNELVATQLATVSVNQNRFLEGQKKLAEGLERFFKLITDDSKSDEQTRLDITALRAGQNETTRVVTTMNGDIDEIKTTVATIMETMTVLSANMTTVLERLDELTKETEIPTEEISGLKPISGEPALGKVTVVGKPTVGITPTKSVTYPGETEKDGA